MRSKKELSLLSSLSSPLSERWNRLIVSVTYKNERISIKKQLNLHKMFVTSLLRGPWANLWPVYGLYCKRFSLAIYKVYIERENLAQFPIRGLKSIRILLLWWGTGGREGYGRREKKGREAGSLRWREEGEKFKKAVKETNPTTFLDFHLTFSEA